MFYNPAEGLRPAPLKFSPLKALTAPRPIGWITSMSAAGEINLAPFSYFNAFAEDPPVVAYAPNGTKPDGSLKDSLVNVRETGEFVFNLVTWELREAMNRTAAHEPSTVDEMRAAGLEPAPSMFVKPPRVAASPAAFECKLLQIVELPKTRRGVGNWMVIGQVVGVHIDESVIVDGIVDITRIKPVARLGYKDYCVVTETFTMERPD